MKKGLKNSLLALGLAGILAGCQNPTYWSVTNQRGPTTTSTKPVAYDVREHYVFERENFHNYKKEDQMDVPVKELKIFSIQDVTTKTTPIYTINWTAQQKPSDPIGLMIGYTLFSTITAGICPTHDLICLLSGNKEKTQFYDMCVRQTNQTRIPGTEKSYSKTLERNDTSETKGQPYAKKQINPAKNFPIETTGKGVKINGQIPPSTIYTDEEGILRANFSPVEGFANQTNAENYARGILRETYKPEKLEELASGLPLFETKVEPFSIKTKDDELKFIYTSFIPIDNRQVINRRIKSQLERYLSEKFPMKVIPLEVIQKYDEEPLRNVKVKTLNTTGPTKESVLAEEKEFLGSFLRHSSDIQELIANPSDYISTFPENFIINERMTAKINQDCIVTLKVTHSGHYAQTVTISAKDTNGKIIIMPKTPAEVEQREAAEDAGKGLIKEIQK